MKIVLLTVESANFRCMMSSHHLTPSMCDVSAKLVMQLPCGQVLALRSEDMLQDAGVRTVSVFSQKDQVAAFDEICNAMGALFEIRKKRKRKIKKLSTKRKNRKGPTKGPFLYPIIASSNPFLLPSVKRLRFSTI